MMYFPIAKEQVLTELRQIVKKKTEKSNYSLFKAHGTEPNKTSFLAKSLGLTYMGFGRYGKGDKVTHIVKNNALQPVTNYDSSHVDKELHSLKTKAKKYRSKSGDIEHDDEDKQTLSKYFNGKEIGKINSYLGRADTASGLEKHNYETKINKLDTMLKKHTFKSNEVYYMATSEMEPGSYAVNGFTTISKDLDKLEKFGGHIVELHVSKGKKGMKIDNDEALLPRKTSIRISGSPLVTTNHKVWKAELV